MIVLSIDKIWVQVSDADSVALQEKTVQQSEPEGELTVSENGFEMIGVTSGEDKEGYRALFTDERWEAAIPWRREMFVNQLVHLAESKRHIPQNAERYSLANRCPTAAEWTKVVL